jgi:hypothetical protein
VGAYGPGPRWRRCCWVLRSSSPRTRARRTVLATTCPAAIPSVPTQRPGTGSSSGRPSGAQPAPTQGTSCAPTPGRRRPATCRDACAAFAVGSGTGETRTATSTRAGTRAPAVSSSSASTAWCSAIRRPATQRGELGDRRISGWLEPTIKPAGGSIGMPRHDPKRRRWRSPDNATGRPTARSRAPVAGPARVSPRPTRHGGSS